MVCKYLPPLAVLPVAMSKLLSFVYSLVPRATQVESLTPSQKFRSHNVPPVFVSVIIVFFLGPHKQSSGFPPINVGGTKDKIKD